MPPGFHFENFHLYSGRNYGLVSTIIIQKLIDALMENANKLFVLWLFIISIVLYNKVGV